MAADDTVNVKVAVDQTEVQPGVDQANTTITSMLDTWKSSFDTMFTNVSSTMKNMTGSITSEISSQKSSVEGLGKSLDGLKNFNVSSLLEGLGSVGVAIGGIIAACGALVAAITEVVSKTAEYGHELEKTSQITGVSTDSLQAWSLGAQECGLNADAFEKATKKLSREIAELVQGSDKVAGTFDEMGISQVEVAKHSEDMEWIVRKVADSFKNHKDGLEKARIAQELFGKAGLELIPLLNQGSEGFDELAKKAKDLGIVMGKDDIKAAKAYTATSADLHAAWSGFCRDIGEIFMPALSKILGWLTSFIEGCEKVCSGIADIAVDLGKLAGIGKWNPKDHSDRMNAIEIEKEAALNKIVMVNGESLNSYNKRKAAAEDYYKKKMEWIKSVEEANKKAEDDKGKDTFVTPPKKHNKKDKPDNKQQNEEIKNAEALVKELEKIKEDGLKQELKDVEEHIKETQKFSAEDLANEQDIIKREHTAKLEALNKERAEERAKSLDTAGFDKVTSAMKVKLKIEEVNSLMSLQQKYEDAVKKSDEETAVETKRSADDANHLAKESADLDIEIARAKNAILVTNGSMTDSQMLKADIALDNQMIASDTKYYDDLLAQTTKGTREYDKALADRLKNKKQNTLLELADDKKMAEQENKIWKDLQDKMSQELSSSITSMLKKEQTFTQSLKNMWNGLLSYFIDFICKKMLEEWITTANLKMLWNTICNLFITTGNETTAGIIAETDNESASSSIEAWTALAAIEAASSVASIPYVGPVLAATAFGAMEGFGQTAMSQASAAGGYDIPAGVNPVVQTHAQEMILPAPLANSIRNMTGKGGSGGGNTSTNVSVHAIDSKSFSRYLSGNKKAIKSLGRNFSM